MESRKRHAYTNVNCTKTNLTCLIGLLYFSLGFNCLLQMFIFFVFSHSSLSLLFSKLLSPKYKQITFL